VKFNDAITGVALIVLGLGILWHIQGYPEMPGQKYGPAWFPGIAGGRHRALRRGARLPGPSDGQRWLVLDEWMSRKRPVAGFVSVIVGLAFYVVASEPLGFHLTGFVLLSRGCGSSGPDCRSRSRWRWSRRSRSTSPSTRCCAFRFHGACSSDWLSDVSPRFATPLVLANYAAAFALVFDPYVLWVIFASALFGLFVGAVPGLTATMATALLVR
jgi:hypothetical protein